MHPLNHRLVAAGALEGVQQRVVALLRVGKKVDEGGHVVVDHQRQVGLGGGQIGSRLGHQVGIDGKGHVAGHFGGRGLFLGHKAVALLSASISSALTWSTMWSNSSCNCGSALMSMPLDEHQVDGAIELHLGFGQLALAIVGLAAGVGLLHLLDQGWTRVRSCVFGAAAAAVAGMGLRQVRRAMPARWLEPVASRLTWR